MAYRHKEGRSKGRKSFKRNAMRTHKKNDAYAGAMRGGIRL